MGAVAVSCYLAEVETVQGWVILSTYLRSPSFAEVETVRYGRGVIFLLT